MVALTGSDIERCYEVLDRVTESRTRNIQECSRLLQEALYLVGKGWSSGGVTVDEEHVSTATTQLLLVELAVTVRPRTRDGEEVIPQIIGVDPDMVCVSVAIPHGLRSVRELDAGLAEWLVDKPALVIGGLAVKSYPAIFRDALPDARICSSDVTEAVDAVLGAWTAR